MEASSSSSSTPSVPPSIAQYKLVSELLGHESDVRSVCAFDNGTVGSGSRDRSVKVWLPQATPEYTMEKNLYGHEKYVSVVIYVPPNEFVPTGTIASGGNDNQIIIWDLATGSPLLTLLGHTDTVCALAVTATGNLLSGSWDATARVWNGTTCTAMLKGHQSAVWAILSVDSTGEILTGSADKTIKRWQDGKCVHTYTGHTDVVRSLVTVPGLGFASASNDSSIRIWTYTGECINELYGHNSFIYSLSTFTPDMSDSFSDTLLASVGEDRALKIWKENTCIQTIQHPATVWSVVFVPHTGDIVTGSSDGTVRVWSRDSARHASAEKLKAYDEAIEAQAISKSTLGALNPEILPTPAYLSNPGKKDGEHVLIRNGATVECHQWSSADSKWVKVGTVVDAVGSNTRQTLNGREYDYVFDVDLEDGGPARKLGYNANQNPYIAAQEFIWEHELSQEFLEQIAKFIIQNTSPVTIGGAPSGGDALTGGFSDPLTGGSRHVPASTAPASAPVAYFPHKSVLTFEAANTAPILAKLKEFNGALGQNESLALSNEQLTRLGAIFTSLASPSVSQTFSDLDFAVLLQLLKWPAANLFPVFDLVRMLWLKQSAAEYLLARLRVDNAATNVFRIALDALRSATVQSQITIVRGFANMCSLSIPREFIGQHQEQVLETVADLARSDNKAVRTAVATLLLNFAVGYLEKPNNERKLQAVSILAELLSVETDPESAFRALVALGTLVWHDEQTKALASDLEVKASLEKFVGSETTKVKGVATELKALF